MRTEKKGEKKKQMNKDLTVGRPERVLWMFCLPLFGSIIFQQLYNIADSLVAGKFIGENALAAVGNSYEITLIFIAFAFGCNIGCSVIVSQLFGAKRLAGLFCRAEDDLDNLYSDAPAVFSGGKMAFVPVYGSADGYCDTYRNFVFEDSVTILSGGIGEAGGRWNPARHRTDETVYGDDVYRSAAACNACNCALTCVWRDWYLVRMAGRLVDRYDFVAAVLPQGRLGERMKVTVQSQPSKCCAFRRCSVSARQNFNRVK